MHLIDFPPCFTRVTTFVPFLFDILRTKHLLQTPSEKGSTPDSKESKFFPFRVDPFSKGRQNNFVRVVFFKVYIREYLVTVLVSVFFCPH